MRTLVNRDLKFYFFFFLHHWVSIFLVSVIAGAVMYGVAKFLLRPKYTTQTILYIGRSNEHTSVETLEPGSEAELRNAVVNLRAGTEMVTDLKFLLQTERFQMKVNQLFTARHYGVKPQFYTINVENPKNSRYLLLNVSSTSAEEAVELANLMGDVFLHEIEDIFGVHNSQVIDPARMPKAPFYPRVKVMTAVAVLLAAVGTFLFFFLLYFFDSRLNGADDLQMAVQLPVLGEIPLDNFLLQEIENGGAKHHIVATLGAKEDAKHANISEAFRILRNNVRYTDTLKDSSDGRVLVMTSSVPGEGKSFIASNLATSFAELGYHTLVINCDLHKAMFRMIFGIPPSGGLVDILSTGESFENCVSRNYMDLPLDILPCGPIPPNPAKLLDSAAFKEFLSQLKKQYQYIILDAPPISAVADTMILGKLADGIILVVRDRYTREEALKASVEQLKLVDAEVFGVIMNGVASQRNSYYSYGRYGYGYGYGYGGSHYAAGHARPKDVFHRLQRFFAKRK
ncbi:MAG: polysaccharide biosynthesis tyrosine autokinase [Victivallaceae bacterium]|nr:polysaccharide biosynthesis tyrosine autokinase [Victivallaceae bacterium]